MARSSARTHLNRVYSVPPTSPSETSADLPTRAMRGPTVYMICLIDQTQNCLAPALVLRITSMMLPMMLLTSMTMMTVMMLMMVVMMTTIIIMMLR